MAREVIPQNNATEVIWAGCLERLNDAIRAQHISNRQLAKAVGVSAAAVNHWTKGKTIPDSCHLFAVCMTLGVTPNEILFGPEWERHEHIKK